MTNETTKDETRPSQKVAFTFSTTTGKLAKIFGIIGMVTGAVLAFMGLVQFLNVMSAMHGYVLWEVFIFPLMILLLGIFLFTLNYFLFLFGKQLYYWRNMETNLTAIFIISMFSLNLLVWIFCIISFCEYYKTKSIATL
jgi:hypothetical protein